LAYDAQAVADATLGANQEIDIDMAVHGVDTNWISFLLTAAHLLDSRRFTRVEAKRRRRATSHTCRNPQKHSRRRLAVSQG